ESQRHHGEAVVRYGDLVAEEAARSLHPAPGADSGPQQRIARVESRRNTADTLAGLQGEARTLAGTKSDDAWTALRVARRLRRWKKEIVDGPNVSPGVR